MNFCCLECLIHAWLVLLLLLDDEPLFFLASFTSKSACLGFPNSENSLFNWLSLVAPLIDAKTLLDWLRDS